MRQSDALIPLWVFNVFAEATSAGGGIEGQVTINRLTDTNIDTFIGETYTATITTYTVVDGERVAFDPSAITDWRVAIEYHPSGTDVVTAIENADIATTSTTVSFTISSTVNAVANRGKLIPWSLRKVSNQVVYMKGFIKVGYAALKD